MHFRLERLFGPHMMEDIFRHLNEFKNVDLVRLRNQKVFTRDSKLLNDKQYNVKLYEPLAFIKENLMGGYICSLFIKTDIIKHNNAWMYLPKCYYLVE